MKLDSAGIPSIVEVLIAQNAILRGLAAGLPRDLIDQAQLAAVTELTSVDIGNLSSRDRDSLLSAAAVRVEDFFKALR